MKKMGGVSEAVASVAAVAEKSMRTSQESLSQIPPPPLAPANQQTPPLLMSDYSGVFKKVRLGDDDLVEEMKKVESSLLGSGPAFASFLQSSSAVTPEARLHRIDMMKFAGEVLKQ